jgi:hypothetical protein
MASLPHTPTWDVFVATNAILLQIAQPFFPSFTHTHSQVGQQQFVYCEKQTIYGF